MDMEASSLLSRPQPPELSPGGSSGSSAPPSPPESPLQPRSLRSLRPSFLIRDILADSRPGPDPGQPELEEDPQDKSPSSGSESESRGGAFRKPRKSRTAFSEHQLSKLETSFQNQKYLNVQDRMELAAALKLSDAQVKTWYQNRRTKWKRQSSAGLELLGEVGSMFLPSHLFPQTLTTMDLHLYRSHAHPHQRAPPPLSCMLADRDNSPV
ncbi:barH-like homeobox 1a isoform X2 [Mugil cephalus]|uniref:barH-like homeobox 1a isoform X2 n=1 Tax=Mugil cephalus TaxID=48193 RepID=UPI001FB81A6C|nr:barH-like homeobox 1a isoform X2 [Mugil cephalus]